MREFYEAAEFHELQNEGMRNGDPFGTDGLADQLAKIGHLPMHVIASQNAEAIRKRRGER